MTSIEQLLKLADQFIEQTQKSLPEVNIGDINYKDEAQKLSMLAGKITYRSHKEEDKQKAELLKHVGSVLLEVSDVMKQI
jgi:hypothetical protein